MLENKKFYGDHYSRYIASWIIGGGYDKYGFEEPFEEWLRSFEYYDCPIKYEWTDLGWKATNLEGIEPKRMPEEVIREIVELANCGKAEFQAHCKKWIKENHDRMKKEYGYK